MVGWIDSSSGKLTLTDRWLSEKNPAGVAMDNGEPSFSDEQGNYEDGMLSISFTRKLNTEVRLDFHEVQFKTRENFIKIHFA